MNLLEKAVQTLAGVCDGAVAIDGQGFNRFDAPFGRSLAESEEWTAKQRRAAWQMLGKYRDQLATAGIKYSEIEEPPVLEQVAPAAKRVSIDKEGKTFMVFFGYDAALVPAVKQLPQRKFVSTVPKHWTVPATASTVGSVFAFAQEYGFEITGPARDKMAELTEAYANNVEASRAEAADLEVTGLGGELYPFQKAGVAYAVSAKRCFLADSMGLGKTIEALATIQALNAYPALVVCPASLKLNWEREAQKWLPGRSVKVLNGGKDQDYAADIVVLNYDILKKHSEGLKDIGFKSIILDESHYLKNYQAARTKACKELVKGIDVRLCLTGTPVLNRPQELLSQLGILGKLEDLGGFWPFAKRYCGAYRGRFGWDMSRSAHLDELNEKLRASCFLRRKKEDVLKELPAKRRAEVPVALSNQAEYNRAERETITWLGEQAAQDEAFLTSIAHLSEEDQKAAKHARADSAVVKAAKAEQLVRIEALKQVSARGKLKAIEEWVESFLETGEKLVLFAHHKEIVESLAEKFGADSITGSTPVKDRQAAVDRFQEDPESRLLVANIQAGGVGITLTAASNVVFAELAWTPAAHEQAEDRLHRIGQQDSVTAWYFLGRGTIDEEIAALIEKKRAVVDAATEGGATAKETGILTALIEKLRTS